MMHGIKVWCPYHKQAAGEKKVPGGVSAAISGGAAASSIAGAALPAASSSSADGANSGEPPAKRQRVSGDVNDLQNAEAVPFCEWEGSYGDLLAVHLKNHCQFHKVPCPGGCGAEIMRSGVELHKSTDCPRFFEECTICGSRVKASDMEEHRAELAVVHAGILEKQNKELLAKVAGLEKANADLLERGSVLEKSNADLTKTNADLINSVLPQLQSVQTTTDSLKATTATKSDVQSTERRILTRVDNNCTTSILLGSFSATWTLNVTDLLKTCTKTGDRVSSDKFAPIPGMTFRVQLFPYGAYVLPGDVLPGELGVFLFLLAGASWQIGEVEFELSAGQNKFPKKTRTVGWKENEYVVRINM